MAIIIVNLSSFHLKTFSKLNFVLGWLARPQQSILKSQLCLQTLMQTCLLANQSVCTILVIL